jgi:hypothetical protein
MAHLAAIHVEAAAIAAQIDTGNPLEPLQYKQLLDDIAAMPAGAVPPLVAAVNGGGDPQPRIIVLDGGNTSVLNPDLMETYLAGRNGVIVATPESLQPQKKRRSSGRPDDVSYEGNALGGRLVDVTGHRASFQPNDCHSLALYLTCRFRCIGLAG